MFMNFLFTVIKDDSSFLIRYLETTWNGDTTPSQVPMTMYFLCRRHHPCLGKHRRALLIGRWKRAWRLHTVKTER